MTDTYLDTARLHDLLQLVLKYNAKDFHINFDYAGHTERFDLYYHKGGWTPDAQPVFIAMQAYPNTKNVSNAIEKLGEVLATHFDEKIRTEFGIK